MDKPKKTTIFLLFLIVVILNSALIYADEMGCCANPGAGDYLCSDERLVYRDLECCPTPEEDYPGYYYDAETNPSGPQDYGDCAANYFYSDTGCSLVDDCSLGCCCGSSIADIKTKAECAGASMTFHQGTTDCSDVCGVSECSDGVDNDDNGCADYPDDNGCDSPDDVSESGGSCGSIADCYDSSYTPNLNNFAIEPSKGEKQFEISWTDECYSNMLYYEISRCLGSGCSDFALIGTSTENSFIDNSDGLLFSTYYHYKIEAHYSIQTATPTAESTGNLGDLECWHKMDYTKFCIHDGYYGRYKDYLISYLGFAESSFSSQVDSQFSSKYNTPYYCDDNNKLITADSKCADDKVCVVVDNTPDCLEEPECNYNYSNPFGLYYAQESCENDKYCFYDRSFSIADNCFVCDPYMSCYDYKSQGSCERDNCGVGNCEWGNLHTELGTGVCVSVIEDNCKWCSKTGTEGIGSSKVTSKVFEGCTEEKTQKLSVTGYPCCFKDPGAKSCKDVVCTDYNGSNCGSSQISLDSENKITNPSSDACGIGVCQLFSGECRKNADGDNKADCESNECEKDYFKPNATIVPILDRGVCKGLLIQIFDKTSYSGSETLRTSSDYKTYLCKDCSGGHPFAIYTASTKLIVSNLNVYDSSNGSRLLTLSEGTNTIKYYSEDPSKNIGIVKSVDVRSYGNATGPIIYRVSISGASEMGDIYYTNDLSPTITVEFYEGAYITHAELVNNRNGERFIPSYNGGLQNKFDFKFSGLQDGDYTFELDAKNENGVYMDEACLINMIADNTQLEAIIEPGEGALITEKTLTINLTFNKKVDLISVLASGKNITSSFSSEDDMFFTATLSLPDGNKAIVVNAKDYAGNEISASRNFVVNANPLNITIKEPSYGIASAYTFDVVIETDNDANCRYSFNSNLEYDFMDNFDNTGGTEHKIYGFNQIPDGSAAQYNFYVKCEDDIYGLGSDVFKLIVDTTPPIIETAYAHPNPVVEEPIETKLKVQTDEDVMCKYSETETDYDSMEGRFLDFGVDFNTVNTKNLSLSGADSFTYYIGCENKAELESEIESITVTVDLDSPLTVTDHTLKYSNSTTINLAVETNKKAQCKYSPTDSSVDSGNLFGPSGYSHVKSVELSPGRYTYYAKCKDQYLGGWSDVIEINFAIDTTPPVMQYVNDSSSLSNPEVTWMTDRLRVKWLASDNATSIHYYLYALEEFATLNTIINWTIQSSGGEWLWIEDLNLSNGIEYYFRVKAKNVVGLISDIMESDGITIDTNAKPTSCTNNVKDANESDVDCGGLCSPCEGGKNCDANLDCKSSYCENGVCKAASCEDNIKNQDESDVDCGGSKCQKCADSKKCNLNNDCEGGYCAFGICTSDTCYDGKLSSSESDVDCGGACPTKCSEGKNCAEDNDCDSGLECYHSECTVCSSENDYCGTQTGSDDTDGDGMSDEWEIANGFDPNDSSDGSSDADDDKLTNLDEYGYRTNPNKSDTDKDRYSDYAEVIKYKTDPLDPDSKPKSKIWVILFMLFLGVLVGVAVFVVYHKIVLNKKIKVEPSKPIPRFVHRPITPIRNGPSPEQIKQMKIKKIQEKRIEKEREGRKKIFESFGEEKEEIKEKKVVPTKVGKKMRKRRVKKKRIKTDAFTKLSKIISEEQKKEDQTKIKKVKEERTFKKLRKISKVKGEKD